MPVNLDASTTSEVYENDGATAPTPPAEEWEEVTGGEAGDEEGEAAGDNGQNSATVSENSATVSTQQPPAPEPQTPQADYAQRVAEAQSELCAAVLARVDAALALKEAKDTEKAAAARLQNLLDRGPEHLPLLDKAPEKPADKQPAPPAEPLPEGARSWMRARVLATIAVKNVTIEKGTELTAYTDQDGDVFILNPNNATDSIYLEPEEYEAVIVSQPSAPTSAVADNDAWRSVTIEALGIPAGICKILREDNAITTLGQIADFSRDGAPLTSLKKVGQLKADKIEAAMDAFWARRPEFSRP